MSDTARRGLGLGCVLAALIVALALVAVVGGLAVGLLPGQKQ